MNVAVSFDNRRYDISNFSNVNSMGEGVVDDSHIEDDSLTSLLANNPRPTVSPDTNDLSNTVDFEKLQKSGEAKKLDDAEQQNCWKLVAKIGIALGTGLMLSALLVLSVPTYPYVTMIIVGAIIFTISSVAYLILEQKIRDDLDV